MERAKICLESRREQISLVRMPLKTTKLFLTIAVRGAAHGVSSLLRHPAVMYVALPLFLIAATVSTFVIEDGAVAAFRQIDANSDGFVSVHELTEFFAGSLVHPEQALKLVVEDFGNFIGNSKSTLTQDEFNEWWLKASPEDPLRHPSRYNGGWWREIEYLFADAIWWLLLGVLSSVGLGTGMHSGLLFLFPHIYLACAAADSCKNGNSWSYPTNPFYGPKERAFHCIGEPSGEVSLLQRFLKVAPWCIIWGAGTAMGEIPPYALSYAAAKQGKKQEELEEVSSFDVVNRMKNWMLDKIQKYGFWAILALAAWPNMAFDLCGMACGQFLMPFWTFFGATLIGKAFIKVNMQAVFFVLLFSGDNIERMMRFVADCAVGLLPFSSVADAAAVAIRTIHATREKIGARARGEDAVEQEQQANLLQAMMQGVVVLMVGWFAKSIVDMFAQQQQEEYDSQHLDRLKLLVDGAADEPSDEELQEMLEQSEKNDDVACSSANGVLIGIAGAVTLVGIAGNTSLLLSGAVIAFFALLSHIVVDPQKEAAAGVFMGATVRLVAIVGALAAAALVRDL